MKHLLVILAISLFTLFACKSYDKDFTLKIGQEFKLSIDFLEHESISGLNRVEEVTAIFMPYGTNEKILLAVDTFENDNWADNIETLGLSVKGVSVTDLEDPIHARVKFLPITDQSLSGKSGVVKFRFVVTYPTTGGRDNPVYRSAANKIGMPTPYHDSVEILEYESQAFIQ